MMNMQLMTVLHCLCEYQLKLVKNMNVENVFVKLGMSLYRNLKMCLSLRTKGFCSSTNIYCKSKCSCFVRYHILWLILHNRLHIKTII